MKRPLKILSSFFRKPTDDPSRVCAQGSVFSSFGEALAASGSDGYQTEELVRVVVEKNLAFREALRISRAIGLESMRTVIGISTLESLPELRVLDFGGGGGFHYSIARALVGAKRRMRWNVVETKAIVAAAKQSLAGGGCSFLTTSIRQLLILAAWIFCLPAVLCSTRPIRSSV